MSEPDVEFTEKPSPAPAPTPAPTPAPAPAPRRWRPSLPSLPSLPPWLQHPLATNGLLFLAFKILVLLSSWLLLDRPDAYLRSLSLNWDGENYHRVATEGFGFDGPGPSSGYHWPVLFPLLIRLFASHEMAPFWISNIAGLFAVLVVTMLMGRRAGAFFALFPTWVAYASFGYTESLYVLFAALALLALRRARPIAGGAAAGLASMTRYVGGIPFLTLAVGMWWQTRRSWPYWLRFLAPLAVAGAVVATWHWAATGTPLAYWRSSGPWDQQITWPWNQWDWLLHGWFTNQDVIKEHPSYWLLRNLGFQAISVYGLWLLARAKRWAWFWFSLGAVGLSFFLSGTPAIGIPRYLLSAFPAIAVLGTRIRGGGWGAYAVAAFAGSCFIVIGHVQGFFG